MNAITVICPVYNEEKYIRECIESILKQDYPHDRMEVLFVDGMSTDKTRNIIKDYNKQYPFVKLVDNPKKVVPTALNIGIKKARHDFIIRLDAHAIYPSDYFKVLIESLIALNADNVGGICETLPATDTQISKSIASALSSFFGMGNSHFRIGSSKVMKVDTVPFGCFRKEVFYRIGFFDEELIRNQDDEFNGRIIKNGGSIYLIPNIVIQYFARDKISKVAKMFYQYGLFKPLVNNKLGSPATIRQFFPLFFVLGLVLGGFLSLISSIFAYIYFVTIILYVILSLLFSIKECIKYNNWDLFYLLPVVYFVIHVSYGGGYLLGIYKILVDKPFVAKSNR